MAVTGSGSTTPEAQEKRTVEIKLEITSDNICPFCYLGYKKIVAATEQAKKDGLPVSFSIQFKPFLLDPTLPVDEPVSKLERYRAKFGDKVDAITAGMTERGKPWGINFSYGGTIRNTYHSHRLVEKAWEEGGDPMQRQLIELLFKGYFEEEKDIGDPAWLAEMAVEADVFQSEQEVTDFLNSDELKKETCAEIRHAQSLGISGVPFTVINGKYAVSGAQEPQAFVDIFKKIACGECPCKKA